MINSNNTIKHIWLKFIDTIETIRKGTKEFLNPPVTVEMLCEIEEKMNMKLPDELKTIYLLNNGQVSCNLFEGLFLGLRFMTLEDLYDSWNNHHSIIGNCSIDKMKELYGEYISYPENTVKTTYLNKNWIPFATDTCGNFLGVDLDPDSNGTYGQIFIFGRDERERVVVSDNLEGYINLLLREIEKGNYKFKKLKRFSENKDKVIFWYKDDKHPNDILRKIVKNI